jgi:hypothetical protein
LAEPEHEPKSAHRLHNNCGIIRKNFTASSSIRAT